MARTTRFVDRRVPRPAPTTTLIMSVVAGILVGILLHQTDRIESVATVFGQDGVLLGWVILLVLSIVAGMVFGQLVVPFVVADYRLGWLRELAGPSGATAIAGVVYGIVLWVIGVALAVPILMGAIAGLDRPIPYLHVLSFVGLVVFGFVLGLLVLIIEVFVEG